MYVVSQRNSFYYTRWLLRTRVLTSRSMVSPHVRADKLYLVSCHAPKNASHGRERENRMRCGGFSPSLEGAGAGGCTAAEAGIAMPTTSTATATRPTEVHAAIFFASPPSSPLDPLAPSPPTAAQRTSTPEASRRRKEEQ